MYFPGVQTCIVQACRRAGVQETNGGVEWGDVAIGGKGEGMLFVLVLGSVCPDFGLRPFEWSISALGSLTWKRRVQAIYELYNDTC